MTPAPDDLEWVNLGSGHFYCRYVNTDDEWCGIIERHQRPDNGEQCDGSVLFSLPYGSDTIQRTATERPHWKVVSLEPLTLEPSIHCHPDFGGCGVHGYIRGGQWVDA